MGSWKGQVAFPGDERPKVMWSFLHLLATVGAFVIARICRDALFLSRFDIDQLPDMYVWTALAVAASTYVYSRVVDRVRRDRLVLVVDALLVLLVLGLRATLNWLGTPFIGVLYVAVEAIGSLLLVQFWSFTDDLFDTRQAKRSFGLVASGGILAALLAGTLAGMISRIAGTENLLPLSALLILACLLIASHLARLYPESFSRQRRQATTAGDSGLGQVLSSAHLRTVAWVVLLTFLVITIVDYQFKLFVRYNYLNREAELTRFLAFFQAAAAGLCLVLQLLVTRKLLQFNILLALFLLPAALLAGSVTLLVLPTFLVAVITKAMDNVLPRPWPTASCAPWPREGRAWSSPLLPLPGSKRTRPGWAWPAWPCVPPGWS